MKVKAIFLIFILVSLAVIMTRCSQPQSGGGSSYFPNTEGDTWRYSSTDGSTTMTTAEGMISIASTTAQIFRSTYISASGAISNGETYFRVDNSGVYAYGFLGFPFSIGIPLLVFPLEVGKNWNVFVSGPISVNATVVNRENLTVPAGTFDCYKVHYAFMSGTVESYALSFWFGNNAGITKNTTSASTIETVLNWKNF